MFAALGNRAILRASLASHAASPEQKLQYAQRVDVEHRGIHDAIERGEPEAARLAMRLHLVNSRARLQAATSVIEDQA